MKVKNWWRWVKTRFMNMVLTGKVVIIYIVAVLIPTSALSMVFHQSNFRELERTYYENQENFILSAKENIIISLNQISAAYNYYQNSDTLIELLSGAYPDVSNTIFYYIRDIIPLIKDTRVNPYIKDVYIYGYMEYALNMEKGLASINYLDRTETLQEQIQIGRNVWEITFTEEEPQLHYYRRIYVNTYPYDLGVLMFSVDLKGLLESFTAQIGLPLFFSQPDGNVIGYVDGNFVHYGETPEVLTDKTAHVYTLTFPEGFPRIQVLIPPMEQVQEQSSLMLFTLIIMIFVFTAFYFLLNFSITSRLEAFAVHISNADAEELTPFEDRGYQDEVGVTITSYNELVKRTNNLIHENLKAEIHRRKADYYALQAQIHPHFLFNILENIRMSAEANHDTETADMLLALGKHMRYNLNKSFQHIQLEEELYSAKNYLQICKIRMKDKIKYEVFISTEIKDVFCPRFLLQPLLENALQHGYRMDRQLHIRISVSEGEEWGIPESVRICVEDDGNGIPEELLINLQQKLHLNEVEESHHVGLLNVNSRLSSFQGSIHGCIFLESREKEGTTLYFYLSRGQHDRNL